MMRSLCCLRLDRSWRSEMEAREEGENNIEFYVWSSPIQLNQEIEWIVKGSVQFDMGYTRQP